MYSPRAPQLTLRLGGGLSTDSECTDIQSEAELKSVETLHGVIRKQTVDVIAKFLRRP